MYVAVRRFEGSQAGAALRKARTLEELADAFVDRSDGDRRLVGIDPHQDLLMSAGTSVSVGPLPSSCAKDIPTSGGAAIPLLSHSARRSLRRDASREQANPSLMGDRKLASDPCKRRPRSLAAADHRAPDRS
jgi:hypothetical protein